MSTRPPPHHQEPIAIRHLAWVARRTGDGRKLRRFGRTAPRWGWSLPLVVRSLGRHRPLAARPNVTLVTQVNRPAPVAGQRTRTSPTARPYRMAPAAPYQPAAQRPTPTVRSQLPARAGEIRILRPGPVERFHAARHERVEHIHTVRHDRVERQLIVRERQTVTRASLAPSVPRPSGPPPPTAPGPRPAGAAPVPDRPVATRHGPPAPALNVDILTDQVLSRIERRARAQRERLGRM